MTIQERKLIVRTIAHVRSVQAIIRRYGPQSSMFVEQDVDIVKLHNVLTDAAREIRDKYKRRDHGCNSN